MPRARIASVCPATSPHLLVPRRCPCLCALVALQASSFMSLVSLHSFRSAVHSFVPSAQYSSASSFSSISLRLPAAHPYFGLFSDFLRSSSVGAFLPCLMVCLLASSSGDMPSLLSHEIFLGKVDVNPGIARFFAVQCYVPESYFIRMVASHKFK